MPGSRCLLFVQGVLLPLLCGAGYLRFKGRQSHPNCGGNLHGLVESTTPRGWTNIDDLPYGDNDDAYQVEMCGPIPAGTRVTVSDRKRDDSVCSDDTTDILVWKDISSHRCICVDNLEKQRVHEYFYQDFKYHTNLNGKASAFTIVFFSDAEQADFSACRHDANHNCPRGQGGTGISPWHGCSPCNFGTYNDGLWARAPCTLCPEGKTTVSTGSNSLFDCILCPPGHSGGGCTPCDVGSWKDSIGDAACTACRAGTTTAQSGSTSSADCVCPPELIENNQGTDCVSACPEGQYAFSHSGSGKLFCAVCPGMPGCQVQAGCDGASSGSYCPNQDCEKEQYYVGPSDVCLLRKAAPTVRTTGPFAEIWWNAPDAGPYEDFSWKAEVEQQDKRHDILLEQNGDNALLLEWREIESVPTSDRSFRLRLRRTHLGASWSEETLWSDVFTFSCECAADLSWRAGKDGEPSVAAVQNKQHVTIQLEYHSYCANRYAIKRVVGAQEALVRDWQAAPMDCSPLVDETRYHDLSSSQHPISVGTVVEYRVYAKNVHINYDRMVPVHHQVEFWTVVKGGVHSQNMAGVQMSGVNITVSVDPAYAGGRHVSFSQLTEGEGGNAFGFEILVQSAKITTASVPVTITAQYPGLPPPWTPCAALGSVCTCEGGLVRLTNGVDSAEIKAATPLVCDGKSFPSPIPAGNLACECSYVKHRFDCRMLGDGCKLSNPTAPPNKQTRHAELTLVHTSTTDVIFFDISTYTLSGKVTIHDTARYTRSQRPCDLRGAKVCSFVFESSERTEQPCADTDQDGRYELMVPAGQSVTIRPDFRNSSVGDFSGGEHSLSRVLSNVAGLDFEFTRKQRLEIRAGGGMCLLPVGEFIISLTISSCSDYERSLGVKTREVMWLGPADFTVRVVSFEPGVEDSHISAGAVPAYLKMANRQTQYVNFWSLQDGHDLSAALDEHANAYLEFVYRTPLQLHFEARPGLPAGGIECRGVPVAVQGSLGELRVFASEVYGDHTCHEVIGQLTIVDQVSDADYACTQPAGCRLEIGTVERSGSNVSGVQLPLFPREPKLFPPYQRSFFVYWDDPGRIGEENQPFQFPLIVTGHRKMGDSFSVTLSEGNPRTVVYDPPGGHSFSRMVEGEQLKTHLTFTKSSASGRELELDVLFGKSIQITWCNGLGVQVCTKTFEGNFAGGYRHEYQESEGASDSKELTFSVEVESAVTTSDQPDLPGFYSDVVVASAFTVVFERTRKLEVDPEKCETEGGGVRVFDSAVYRPALEGFVVKTFYDIEFVELPKIADNMQIIQKKLRRDEYTDDADGQEEEALDRVTLQRLNITDRNWRFLIAEHERRREADGDRLVSPKDFVENLTCVSLTCREAMDASFFNFGKDNNRIFFSGGGTAFGFSTQTTQEEVRSITQTYDMRTAHGLRFEGQQTLGTFFAKEDFANLWTTEIHKASEDAEGTMSSTTVDFSLIDPDVGDSFDVEIWYDKEYGTPYFKTIAGASMCPGELGTVPRMAVEMAVEGLQSVVGIPQGAVYTMAIDLINRSPTDEDSGDYLLTYDKASNPHGLKLRVDGKSLDDLLVRRIPVGQPLRVNLELEAASGHFRYDNVKLLLVAQCELGMTMLRDGVHAELEISLQWQQDCPEVEFSGEMADHGSFTVTKQDSTNVYTIDVIAHNPNHFASPWSSHSTLQEVFVRFRRVGDAPWSRAIRPGGAFAVFNLLSVDASGFAEVEVDVTSWTDGEYQLSLLAYCGNEPGAIGSATSGVIPGRVDRVRPGLFSGFAEPADGWWTPGERIAARMTEEIDCRLPLTFDANIEILQPQLLNSRTALVIGQEHLDIKCIADTVELAFSAYSTLYHLPGLRGANATVFLENVHDVAGNVQEATISWSFSVADFNVGSMALTLTLRFRTGARRRGALALYTDDPAGFESAVAEEVCSLMSCTQALQVHTRADSDTVWVDVQLPPDGDSLRMAARLYARMGNATTAPTVPSSMLLAQAEVCSMTYVEGEPSSENEEGAEEEEEEALEEEGGGGGEEEAEAEEEDEEQDQDQDQEAGDDEESVVVREGDEDGKSEEGGVEVKEENEEEEGASEEKASDYGGAGDGEAGSDEDKYSTTSDGERTSSPSGQGGAQSGVEETRKDEGLLVSWWMLLVLGTLVTLLMACMAAAVFVLMRGHNKIASITAVMHENQTVGNDTAEEKYAPEVDEDPSSGLSQRPHYQTLAPSSGAADGDAQEPATAVEIFAEDTSISPSPQRRVQQIEEHATAVEIIELRDPPTEDSVCGDEIWDRKLSSAVAEVVSEQPLED